MSCNVSCKVRKKKFTVLSSTHDLSQNAYLSCRKKCVNFRAIGNLFPNLYGHHSHKNTQKIHSINEKTKSIAV